MPFAHECVARPIFEAGSFGFGRGGRLCGAAVSGISGALCGSPNP